MSTQLIWGMTNRLSSDFLGIQDVENAKGNSIKIMWNPISYIVIDSWNIYIKPNDSDDIFTPPYRLGKFPNLYDSIFIRTEANPNILLSSENEYYLGVRYEKDGVEDGNTSVLKIRPFVINNYWINDRQVGII